MTDRTRVAGPTLGVTAVALVVGAATFLPLGATRAHTVSESKHRLQQARTLNTFWHVTADPDLAASSHLAPDLLDFAGLLRTKANDPDPARALSTFSTTDKRYDDVSDKLGVTATYYPCAQHSHSQCGDGSPSVIDPAFALQALQATPRDVHYLVSPLPAVKTSGNMGWRLMLKSWAEVTLAVFIVTLFQRLVLLAVKRRDARAQRRAQDADEQRKLAAMGPREREVYLLVQQISAWPRSNERTQALMKANDALKTIRSGELSAVQSTQVAEAYRELDELVTLSRTWQDAYKSIDRG